MFYYITVIASCIALASLLTAILAWRSNESKLTYTLVFVFLSYVLLISAFQTLVAQQPSTIEQFQNIYNAFQEKHHEPASCKTKPTTESAKNTQ